MEGAKILVIKNIAVKEVAGDEKLISVLPDVTFEVVVVRPLSIPDGTT